MIHVPEKWQVAHLALKSGTLTTVLVIGANAEAKYGLISRNMDQEGCGVPW